MLRKSPNLTPRVLKVDGSVFYSKRLNLHERLHQNFVLGFRNVQKFIFWTILVNNYEYKSLRPKFKILTLTFVGVLCLFEYNPEHSSFQTLGGVRSGNLETIFWMRVSESFACPAGVQNYICYGITLLMLL